MTIKTLGPLRCAAIALALSASIAHAENIRIESQLSVAEATDKLEGAILRAGATVMAAVDYQKGAQSVGQNIRPTKVVIFGSPDIGAEAFNIGQGIGLYLPLRVLAYEDAAGKVWLMYKDPADAAAEHGIPRDHPAIKAMQNALKKLTGIASGNS